MSVIGFDIGNENCYVAAVKSGGIEILDNEYSLRSTPTYVAFTEKSRDIGVSARNKLITNLENTVFGFKRIIGKKYDEAGVEDELAYLPLQTCELPSGYIGVKVNYLKNNCTFSCKQLMAMMLTKLKMISESKLKNKIRECVIAVPAYYTDAQRRVMLDAVSIAGLNALKLLNESTAVAISYGFFKQHLSDQDFLNVVFVDFGNSTLTVTACAYTKDKAKILGCVWDFIGGRNFDTNLAKHFINDFKMRYNIDATTSKKAVMTLMLECEMLKKVMSANSLEVRLNIECFLDGKDVSGKLKRENFENLSTFLLDRIEITLNRILVETQLNPSNIHAVEIIGGSSRIPAVKRLIQKVFGREPSATLNQDEAVARGCALECAMLSPLLKTRKYVVEDIPSYIIKLRWTNLESKNEELEVFNFSDKLPSSKMITLSLCKPFTIVAFFIDRYSKLSEIGTFTLGSIPEDVDIDRCLKVKIKACLNIHGIFTLSSAKMYQKSIANEQSGETESNDDSTENKDDSSETKEKDNVSSPNESPQNVKSSYVSKLCDLTINSDVSGLTKIRLNEYINAEQQMILRDFEEKEKADAFNALEEFIYDIRGKLNHMLEEFIEEKDKSTLLQNLTETENWMYENSELEAAEYVKKLNSLQSQMNPIFKRYFEWQERPGVMDNYRQVLQKTFDAISSISKDGKSSNFGEDILVENLRKIWQNAKAQFDERMDCFSTLKKTDQVPLPVDELEKSLKNFQTEFQNSFSELQRKMENVQASTDSSSFGDGNIKDSKDATPVSEPSNEQES